MLTAHPDFHIEGNILKKSESNFTRTAMINEPILEKSSISFKLKTRFSNHIYFGVANTKHELSSWIGSNDHSWGFGVSAKKWKLKKNEPYGIKANNDDTVTVEFDPKEG